MVQVLQVDTDLGTLSSTMPRYRSVRHIVHRAATNPLRINCDRCSVSIEEVHYHCLESNGGNYDLCMKCACKGIYCENDTHYWVKRGVKDGRHFDIGDKIPPSITRTIQQSPRKTYPLKFDPSLPEDTPHRLFAHEDRYIRKSDPREILIFTGGECLRSGMNNPQAGWSFIYRPSAFNQDGRLTHDGTISCRLENKGPTGHFCMQTSHRAELRAVIGALQFRDWSKDCNRGWRSVVIATDSQYVTTGATEWVRSWELEGWKHFHQGLRRMVDAKNQDLWELLLVEVRWLQAEVVNVSLWRITSQFNARAKHFAQQAAEKPEMSVFNILEADGPIHLQSRPFLCGPLRGFFRGRAGG